MPASLGDQGSPRWPDASLIKTTVSRLLVGHFRQSALQVRTALAAMDHHGAVLSFTVWSTLANVIIAEAPARGDELPGWVHTVHELVSYPEDEDDAPMPVAVLAKARVLAGRFIMARGHGDMGEMTGVFLEALHAEDMDPRLLFSAALSALVAVATALLSGVLEEWVAEAEAKGLDPDRVAVLVLGGSGFPSPSMN